MTHVTTQLKTLKSPVALYSKSLKCNLGIFLIFFLIRLRYRPFSIGEIVSHVLWPLALEPAPSSTRSCLHIQGEIISHVLKPLKRFDTLFLYQKTERVARPQTPGGNCTGSRLAALGLCNYGGLIDTLFTDVEGVV